MCRTNRLDHHVDRYSQIDQLCRFVEGWDKGWYGGKIYVGREWTKYSGKRHHWNNEPFFLPRKYRIRFLDFSGRDSLRILLDVWGCERFSEGVVSSDREIRVSHSRMENRDGQLERSIPGSISTLFKGDYVWIMDSIRPHVTYGYHPRRVARLGGRILSSKYTWTRYAAFCLQKFLCFKIARQNIIEGPQRAGMGF